MLSVGSSTLLCRRTAYAPGEIALYIPRVQVVRNVVIGLVVEAEVNRPDIG